MVSIRCNLNFVDIIGVEPYSECMSIIKKFHFSLYMIPIFIQKGQNVYHIAARAGEMESLRLLSTISEDYPELTQELITKACLATDRVSVCVFIPSEPAPW